MADCGHENIRKGILSDTGEAVWGCQDCGLGFAPAGEQQAVLTQTLDSVAATFSAILWDYSERVMEKYGVGTNKDLMPEGQEPPIDKDECGITVPHDYNGEQQCQNCGFSPFLGSD